jgi:glycosyltransferase involved in cell wall biosynthesis
VKLLSVIVPARNEEAAIAATLDAILAAAAAMLAEPVAGLALGPSPIEVLVVDNASTDRTRGIVEGYADRHGVRLLECPRLKAPCARNFGTAHSTGRILCFVDADTWVPVNALARIHDLCERDGFEAGIGALAAQEPGPSAWLWWLFWNHVRRLPLARAKALPAFMFCTREVFAELGPFDERVVIGEEWPILAGLQRARPGRLVYDRSLVARTSSRRMALRRFGYLRTFCKYVWAILTPAGRVVYSDHVRHALPPETP